MTTGKIIFECIFGYILWGWRYIILLICIVRYNKFWALWENQISNLEASRNAIIIDILFFHDKIIGIAANPLYFWVVWTKFRGWVIFVFFIELDSLKEWKHITIFEVRNWELNNFLSVNKWIKLDVQIIDSYGRIHYCSEPDDLILLNKFYITGELNVEWISSDL